MTEPRSRSCLNIRQLFRRSKSVPTDPKNPAPIQNKPAPLPSHSQSKPLGEDGLQPLTDPIEPSGSGLPSNGLDIIAIHGLNGHPLRTWTSESSGVETLWLRDLLPVSLPGARVFTFGYNSNTFFSHGTGNITTFAHALLHDMELRRESQTHASRQLVFICHSMGGLVCKKCLIAANEDRERFQWVLELTRAIYFFGTPHGGSAIAESALGLAKIFQSLNSDWAGLVVGRGKPLRTDLIKELHPDSKALQELSDSFSKLSKQLKGLKFLISFWEEKQIDYLNRVVVTRKSAVVGLAVEEKVSLPGDHFAICRIGDTNNRAFRTIVFQCQQIMQEGAKLLSEAENSCLASLRPPNVSESSAAKIGSAKGTCEWILSIDEFNKWRDGLPPLLWISGELGCGKTTLMSFLRGQFCPQNDDNARSEDATPRPIVGSFFCDDRYRGSMQAHIILQGLIYDIVSQRRELLYHVTKPLQTCSSLSYAMLGQILKNILDDPRTDGACIIIDGLDECDVNECRPVLEHLASYLGHKSTDGKRLVNLIVASRPAMTREDWGLAIDATVVRLDEDETMRELVIGDIRRFATGKLLSSALGRDLKADDRQVKLKDLGITIAIKSKGSFLWAALIVTKLTAKSVLQFANPELFIAECPGTFQDMYLKCLKEIEPHYKEEVHKTFAILVAARRPLKLSEFKSALAIEANHRDLEDLHEAIDEMENLVGFLHDVLSSLILLDDSAITFRHQGVKDYLLHKLAESAPDPCTVYAMSIEEAECTLAQSCINFLHLTKYSRTRATEDIDAEFWQDSGLADIDACSSSSRAETLEDPALIYHDPESQFFQYAASNWACHISESDGFNPELLDNALALLTNQTLLSNWTRQFRRSYVGTNNLPEKVNPLIVSAYFGHTSLIERILAEDSNHASLDVALTWATRMGHLHTVKSLIKHGIRDARAMVDGRSAICWASIGGYKEIARSLLASDKSLINCSDVEGRCPLSLAVQHEHKDLVNEFLDAADINANMGDRGGATPIFYTFDASVLSKRQRTILLKLLSHEGTSINLKDRRDRTVLSHAAEVGATDFIQELSKHRERKKDFAALLADAGDKCGISPLSHATQGGHLETVRFLCRTRKIDKQFKSVNIMEKGNVFDVAARTNRPLIIEEIAKYYPEGVNSQDQSGRTPLSTAMTYQIEAVIRALLKAGADPNKPDYSGRSPLSFGLTKNNCVKLLVEEYGADINLRDNEGHTPLFLAGAYPETLDWWKSMGAHL